MTRHGRTAQLSSRHDFEYIRGQLKTVGHPARTGDSARMSAPEGYVLIRAPECYWPASLGLELPKGVVAQEGSGTAVESLPIRVLEAEKPPGPIPSTEYRQPRTPPVDRPTNPSWYMAGLPSDLAGSCRHLIEAALWYLERYLHGGWLDRLIWREAAGPLLTLAHAINEAHPGAIDVPARDADSLSPSVMSEAEAEAEFRHLLREVSAWCHRRHGSYAGPADPDRAVTEISEWRWFEPHRSTTGTFCKVSGETFGRGFWDATVGAIEGTLQFGAASMGFTNSVFVPSHWAQEVIQSTLDEIRSTGIENLSWARRVWLQTRLAYLAAAVEPGKYVVETAEGVLLSLVDVLDMLCRALRLDPHAWGQLTGTAAMVAATKGVSVLARRFLPKGRGFGAHGTRAPDGTRTLDMTPDEPRPPPAPPRDRTPDDRPERPAGTSTDDAVDADAVNAAEARVAAGKVGSPRGGSYRDLRKEYAGRGDEVHIHHMPADSASTLARGDGPAIAMDVKDHMRTASYDNLPGAKQYRAAQADLIARGRFKEAIEMDIADVRSKFGSKYDAPIDEMISYAKSIGKW